MNKDAHTQADVAVNCFSAKFVYTAFWHCERCLRGRFHGSYEAVYGGWSGNAFTTLTGGISEKMKTWSTDPDEPTVSADKLFRRLNNALASGAFVTGTAELPTADSIVKNMHIS